MCTFMSSLPKYSKSAGAKRPRSNVLTIRPSPKGTYYRFRLLAFSPTNGASDRDDPHIVRYVHQMWGKNPEKGTPVLEDEIICPVTPHVQVEGDRYESCKVCKFAGKYWGVYKDSNFKDREASRKNKTFSRKYQAIVPVYVVNDPCYDGNNGKFRVIIFNDKKKYAEFRDKIMKESMKHSVFNGRNAVDCCIHMSEEEQKYNEGQVNEITFKKRVIDTILFSTKPYDISSITKETVDEMNFDSLYYTSSTPAEIDAFYNKYCKVSNDDIPDQDEIPVYTKPEDDIKPEPAAEIKAAAVEKPNDDVSTKDIDDLLGDSDDEGLEPVKPTAMKPAEPVPEKPAAKQEDDIDTDALLASLDI